MVMLIHDQSYNFATNLLLVFIVVEEKWFFYVFVNYFRCYLIFLRVVITVSSGTVQPDICYDKLKGQLRN